VSATRTDPAQNGLTPATAPLDGSPLPPPSAGPKLTKLEIHGFKSFATRTTIVFERGITAVIGPNGSGKSNVSDAVRWVLGETSQNALRSRKTDDVIFAGGNGRGAMGMAEVTVTFDNSTGWLPSEFAEVTVTRRAFRSGDSNYLINGRRVRLKDVHQLVASLGQSHTVVGQGLMDAALSQRPEERRGLFEHAADLAGLRMKAAEAERNLAEVDSNSTRLNDLMAELEPRLRTLERQARQARDWQSVRDTLAAIQRAHYRELFRAAAELADLARAELEQIETTVRDGEQALAQLVATGDAARQQVQIATQALERADAQIRETAEEAQRVGHQRDLAGERLSALVRRQEDMADTLAGLSEQAATLENERAGVAGRKAEAEASVTEIRTAIAALRRETADVATARTEREREAERLRRLARETERRAGDAQRQAALLAQRAELDGAERERHTNAIAARAERIETARADLATHDAAGVDRDRVQAELADRLTDIAARHDAAVAEVANARKRLADADRELNDATARLRALQHLQESGAGLHAGVRSVMQAARTGDLQGIQGTIGELVALPSRYDTAIEVALGGHLQDVVVDRWADAEAAIAHLRRTRAGRATFQPRDTVRNRRGGRGRPDAARGGHGVHGVASDLVDVDDTLVDIVEALLGRTVVVDDLPAARATLRDLPTGWSTVTLGGEIARAGGSVTGGAQIRETGALARGRELRELPGVIGGLADARDRAAAALAEAERAPAAIAEERRAAEGELAGIRAAAREQAAQRSRLASWLVQLENEQRDAERQRAALETAIAGRADERATIEATVGRLAGERTNLQGELEAAEAALVAAAETAATAERGIGDYQRELATLEERLRSERRREAALAAQRQALDDERATRTERAATLDGEITAVTAQRERLSSEADRLAARLAEAKQRHEPLALDLKRVQAEQARIAQAIDAGRRAQVETERARGEASRAEGEARADLTAIELRIAEDLGLDEPATVLTLADAPPSDDWTMPADPEREITRLKERLRRMGYVGDDVIGEYERESAHHAFTREQLDDVQRAATSLRQLLAELHDTMRQRFEETFGRVAVAFSQAFTELFGGGTARLVMTSSEGNGTSGSAPGGIDIVAQPPGKRLQNLSLLSGGERSLTAAALLIAILRVNPTPFCLLDEVDAALDEANVVRFRAQLQALARETQVIVITHNRGTIESADTLYGITMGADGVSKTLSLRMAASD
jgi:chromosome segregation protein